MRKITSALFCMLLIGLGLQAQSYEKCATMQAHQHHLQQDPSLAIRMENAEKEAENWRAEAAADHPRTVYTIPVVVHVVYTNAAENISTGQILSQIDQLNLDYRRQNPDTAKTRSIFKDLAADAEIEFCLATTDPSGNPTSGITRTAGNPGFLGFYDPFTNNIKANSSGGIDPWPTDKYLNLWVGPLFPGLLGYAQLPGEDPTTDGVVVTTDGFGTIGNLNPLSSKGRTAVHEVGHWLGLRHIWGDGDCTADDFVGDTPNADAASQTDCDTTKNTCVDTTAFDYPDMVENFMDYSIDSCMNMFTEGQKTRMLSFLLTDRVGLLTSQGCSLPSTPLYRELFGKLSVYPNPAQNIAFIEIPQEAGELLSLRVTNALGQEIPFSSEGKGKFRIDLQGTPAGMYFISAETNRGTFINKLIVNH